MSAKTIIELRSSTLVLDPSVDDLIIEAEKETGPVYGDLYDKAVALLVLHWLELKHRSGDGAGGGTTTGMITQEKEGDLSRSYGTGSSSGSSGYDQYLSQTTWGIELLDLKRSTIFAYGNRFGI